MLGFSGSQGCTCHTHFQKAHLPRGSIGVAHFSRPQAVRILCGSWKRNCVGRGVGLAVRDARAGSRPRGPASLLPAASFSLFIPSGLSFSRMMWEPKHQTPRVVINITCADIHEKVKTMPGTQCECNKCQLSCYCQQEWRCDLWDLVQNENAESLFKNY